MPRRKSLPHALIVGGTGMLRPVTESLARTHDVTVVARGLRELAALAAEHGYLRPVRVDYRETRLLQERLQAIVEERGPFDLGVLWIHATAPAAPLVCARLVRGRLFHVLGSTAADPAADAAARRRPFEELPGLDYHEVILGFENGPRGSRWLRDEEIAAGVLAAIERRAPRHVVGRIAPWSERP